MIRSPLFALIIVLSLLGCSAEESVTVREDAAVPLPDEHERIAIAVRQRAKLTAIEAEFLEREAAAASGERRRQLTADATEARKRADEAAAEAAAYTGWTAQQFRALAREAADRVEPD